jgi:hypothetical protein
MTAAREAIGLPLLFLTVVLLGGFRVAEQVRLVPPSLTALVLAVLLIGTLIRSAAIQPLALLNGSRTAAENLSGGIVLLTLFAASAQVLNLLMPDRGLLHAVFAIFLFCQLLTIGAAQTNRAGVLRSLAVLLGSLFVLRFIVIEALYASDGGLLQRLLTTLMTGVSLGSISYEPNAPATGYVALFTLMLYMGGLLLLRPAGSTALARRDSAAAIVRTTTAVALVAAVAASSGCRGNGESPPPRPAEKPAGEMTVSAEQRKAALRAARVWQEPAVPIAQADFTANPPGPGSLKTDEVVDCRLLVKGMGGTTPKFDCERKGKDVIRVKYGRGNPELHAEIAATRLLTALGFGADRMYVVQKVRCAGCPMFPFQALKCLAETKLESACFAGGLDYSKVADFEHVSIERRFEGRRIEAIPDQGWAFYEIDQIDERAGGSPRAHVDALKLLAIIIAHWDNKAENQRLVCLPGGDLPDGSCSKPFAILQDLGASFGPTKLDLHNWRARPVWADPRACRVTMKDLPWSGATFPDARISEQGRQFALSLLDQLSPDQLRALFTAARVELSEGVTAEGRQAEAWAFAFQDKVRQIREAGPCR